MSTGVEHFERLYERSEDPWNYRGSEYEREKYAHTLAAIPPELEHSVLELGCSIGVFTSQLADRFARVTALDFSQRAVELARERLADRDNVEVLRASFPDEAPDGDWELIVCSEVLYYLERPALERALDWLTDRLERGTTVLVVSWRGVGRDEPMLGDDLHDLLAARWSECHALDDRREGYRLDRFAKPGGVR